MIDRESVRRFRGLYGREDGFGGSVMETGGGLGGRGCEGVCGGLLNKTALEVCGDRGADMEPDDDDGR